MTFLFKKNNLAAAMLALGICTSANAMELRPLAQFDFFADATINRKKHKTQRNRLQRRYLPFVVVYVNL